MEHEIVPSVERLKPMLYDLLKTACAPQESPSPAAVTQNLGVSMTNAVKREGVNIIQIQNVKMESIIPKIVDLMQMVDSLSLLQAPEINGGYKQLINEKAPLRIVGSGVCEENAPQTLSEPQEDTLTGFCQYAYDRKLNDRQLVDLVRVIYVDFLTEELGGRKAALSFVGLSPSSVYTARKRVEGENANAEERGVGEGLCK